jgi:hypothetical protein
MQREHGGVSRCHPAHLVGALASKRVRGPFQKGWRVPGSRGYLGLSTHCSAEEEASGSLSMAFRGQALRTQDNPSPPWSPCQAHTPM